MPKNSCVAATAGISVEEVFIKTPAIELLWLALEKATACLYDVFAIKVGLNNVVQITLVPAPVTVGLMRPCRISSLLVFPALLIATKPTVAVKAAVDPSTYMLPSVWLYQELKFDPVMLATSAARVTVVVVVGM